MVSLFFVCCGKYRVSCHFCEMRISPWFMVESMVVPYATWKLIGQVNSTWQRLEVVDW